MTAATAFDWENWLRPIAAAVRNTPAPNDIKGRAAALAFTMPSLPASALTPAKARDLCRKAEFFPSVAEIEAVFAAEWKEQARTRSITSGPARLAPPQQAPVTQAQRDAAVQRAQAVVGELRANNATARPKAEAAPLSPAALLAQYEALAAQGNAAAATRAEGIRKALGR
jgi:hypothetical protein